MFIDLRFLYKIGSGLKQLAIVKGFKGLPLAESCGPRGLQMRLLELLKKRLSCGLYGCLHKFQKHQLTLELP